MADNPYAPPSSDVSGGDSYSNANDVASSTVNILNNTKGWARFLSVLYYIAGVFTIIFAIIAYVQLSRLNSAFGSELGEMSNLPPELRAEMGGGGGMGLFGQNILMLVIFYVVLAVVGCFIPGMILGGYAGNIGRLIMSPSTVTLDAALDKQRGFFKYIGILSIVGIALVILVVVWGLSQTPKF